MARGGRAWRGYFPAGGELTSGQPNLKEGIYFGTELGPDDPRVRAGTVCRFMVQTCFRGRYLNCATSCCPIWIALTAVAQSVLCGVALSLGLRRDYFATSYTACPTVLSRIFHYPPQLPDTRGWGVGERTDYGLVTLLGQDGNGGLQVHTLSGWIDAPPLPGTFVEIIGDMLDRMTGGYYRSTPHRVRNVSGTDRLFPAEVPPLPALARLDVADRTRTWGRRRPVSLQWYVR